MESAVRKANAASEVSTCVRASTSAERACARIRWRQLHPTSSAHHSCTILERRCRTGWRPPRARGLTGAAERQCSSSSKPSNLVSNLVAGDIGLSLCRVDVSSRLCQLVFSRTPIKDRPLQLKTDFAAQIPRVRQAFGDCNPYNACAAGLTLRPREG